MTMTIFGNNLIIVARELDFEVERLGTYRVTANHSATLYDTDYVVNLLNLSPDAYRRFNAWVAVPGFYMGYYSSVKTVVINKEELFAPIHIGSKDIKSSADVFTYVMSQYFKGLRNYTRAVELRMFDILYTMSYLNGLDLPKFLDKFAIKW